MKRLLIASLASAALLFGTLAAEAAPRSPYHPAPREQARWEATHRPDPRPGYRQRPELRRPLPPRYQQVSPCAPRPAYHR